MDGELALVRMAERLLFPPVGPLLLAGLGLFVRSRRPRLGNATVTGAFAVLVVASLPVTGHALLGPLERQPPLNPAEVRLRHARAIIILAGGIRPYAPEYGGSTVSPSTLERVRYGVRLHRLTRLPIVVTGGLGTDRHQPEAIYMDRALREFGVTDVQVEDKSSNTAENARFTARLIGPGRPVLLVTHAAHMARAKRQFEAAGLEVIPAPTGFDAGDHEPLLLHWLPSAGGLELTARALHEWGGRLWYMLRY